jgi:hypothetical protein
LLPQSAASAYAKGVTCAFFCKSVLMFNMPTTVFLSLSRSPSLYVLSAVDETSSWQYLSLPRAILPADLPICEFCDPFAAKKAYSLKSVDEFWLRKIPKLRQRQPPSLLPPPLTQTEFRGVAPGAGSGERRWRDG